MAIRVPGTNVGFMVEPGYDLEVGLLGSEPPGICSTFLVLISHGVCGAA